MRAVNRRNTDDHHTATGTGQHGSGWLSPSNCRPGASPTRARVSASSSRPPPPPPPRRSSAMPARCIASPAAARPSPSTCSGTFRKARRARPRSHAMAARHGVRIGVHQSQHLSGPDLQARLARQSRSARSARGALRHILDCVEIATAVNSRDLSLWFADGSSYPGTANIRHRRQWFIEGLQEDAPADEARAAHAGGVQTVRAGLLSHRYRRLGHGACRWRATPDRRRACWWIPAIITRRRTSSRSWPGCWPKACSAASISTTGATRTTI